MKNMSTAELRIHLDDAISEVLRSQEGLVLTKRGKPIARLLPYPMESNEMVHGKLSHLLDFEDDIVSPLE